MAAFDIASRLIRRHEGVRSKVYDDADGQPIKAGSIVKGHPTIGIGRNLAAVGLNPAEIEYLFATDLARSLMGAEAFVRDAETWTALGEARRAVLADMAFNMGGSRLGTFVRFRTALLEREYDQAADHMLDSRWARQVGARALTLAAIMRSGELPIWAEA